MKPSVGSIVHVEVPIEGNNGSTVAPGIITRVWNDRMVNVRVLLDGPDVRWMTSVTLYDSQDDLEAARIDTTMHAAYWPPRSEN